MRNWYYIKASDKSADIYIYDEIGFWGISASRLVAELRQYKGKALNVYINSPGGDVFDSVAIYNALTRHDGEVNVTVDGIAASGASVIAQAGKSRKMSTGSSMMIHDAWGIAMGDKATMEKMAEELDKISDSVADIYAERTGKDPTEWRQQMTKETWYNAEEAVGAGLADTVLGAQSALRGQVFNLSKFNSVPAWVPQADPSSNTPPPAVQETQEEPVSEELTAIRRSLGLDEDGDVTAAIESLKVQAKDIATGEKGVENALRKENQALRQQLLSQESDYGQRILALEDRNRQKEAEYAVDSAIQAGRVAPKDRDLALKLALNDPEGFASFAANLRVDLDERGRTLSPEEVEVTPEEARLAAQMGISREQLIKQKAQDRGIALPS